MPYASSDGVRLHYEETGDGPAIVFAHELASDLRQWRGQVRALSGHFRCISYNARGYPPSDVPQADSAYEHLKFVEDIGAIQHQLGLERSYLVGWSMGAYAALLFALQNPGRMKGLVLSGIGSGSPPAEIEGFRTDMAALAALYLERGAEAGADQIAAGPNRQPLRLRHPRRWAAWKKNLSGHSAQGMARVCRNYQGRRPSLYDFKAGLAGLDVPTLLIVGEEDAPCIEATQFLADAIPGAELQLFPSAGHAPNLEDPQTFNRVVSAFVDRIERTHSKI